jgi:hypothetical protein
MSALQAQDLTLNEMPGELKAEFGHEALAIATFLGRSDVRCNTAERRFGGYAC